MKALIPQELPPSLPRARAGGCCAPQHPSISTAMSTKQHI